MLLKLYKHNKRENSTLLPKTEDLLISGEVALKNATSIDNPTFILACGESDMFYARICNYAEVNGNYYWVEDTIQLNKNHVEIMCVLDPLATYRNEILETKAYVLYSEHGSPAIFDPRSVPYVYEMYDTASVTVDIFSQHGNFLIAYAGGEGSGVNGLLELGLLTTDNCAHLGGVLNSTDFLDELSKYFSNPYEVIAQMVWVPITNSAITTGVKILKLGSFDTDTPIGIVNSSIVSRKYTVSIPWDSSGYIKSSHYSRVMLFLPFIGLLELPTDQLYGHQSINVYVSVDLLTTEIIYRVTDSANTTIKISSGTCGCELPVTGSMRNPIGVATGVLTAVSSLAMKNPIGVAMGASEISSNASNHTQIGGSIGSRVGGTMGLAIVCYVYRKTLTDGISGKKEVLGLPHCSTIELNELTGYVQTQNASVSAIARKPILNEINNYLNGGVYIE